MIAIFKPVNNAYWFDIREFDIIDGKYKIIKTLKIQDFIWVLDELPVFKPMKHLKPKSEFHNQFTTN